MTTDELRNWMKALEERDVLVWACDRQGLFTAAEVEALKEAGWGQWLR